MPERPLDRPPGRFARLLVLALVGAGLALAGAAGCRPQGEPVEVGICGGKPCPGGAMPGASIGNSKMCKCRACAPARCCTDTEYTDDDAGAPGADDAGPNCTQSYDFDERCALQVKSCAPRCHEHVWRVKKDESCEAKNPAECCSAEG
ncbi:MAG: hypothetical protein HY908_06940 [Myxococcales bacterium]|nr:hypothetical protein [Myxococcales bacterium]